jgi:hypothetical protein
MTETTFTVYRGAFDPPLYLAINSIDRQARRWALREIELQHPSVTEIHMVCWYEGTLPETVTPFRFTRR